MQPSAKPLAPLDADVKLPKAAQAAAARANDYYKKPELVEAPPAADPAPTDAPNSAAPQAPADSPTAEPTAPPAAPVAAEPASTPAEPPKDPKTPPANWDRVLNGMKGRVTRSEQAAAALRSQVSELQEIINTLQAAPRQAPQPKASAPERLITDEDVKDYGQDLLDVVGKKAKEELIPLVAELRNEIATLKGQVSGTTRQIEASTQKQMFATIDAKMPRWREINENQDFLNWLALPDPMSGVIRHKLLNEAVEQSSANRVLAFFQGFLAEEAVLDPAEASASQPAPLAPVVKPSLEAFAAPGRAKSAAASSAPAEKPVITRDQISAFYAEVRRGLYNGREAEKLAAERMISEASREGRIR